ncbi:hypothetical protein ACHAWF_013722 [Thalassiosira exigua]
MLAFAALLAAAMAVAVASSSSSSASSPLLGDVPPWDRRVLTNPATGTIVHPLIPHRAHLDRRRRELREERGVEAEESTLPPRPRVSRHSQTPADEAFLADADGRHFLRSANDADADGRRDLQQQMGALYQGYGTHYVDLWVGSPNPQRQTVIVDTGSGVTAFPCEECKGCGDSYHTDHYYKHSESKTFRPLKCNECFRGYCATMSGGKKCRISMSYAEGSSWSAYEAQDLCYAGGPHDKGLKIAGAATNLEDVTLDRIDPVDASQFAFELAFGCQVSITGLFITQLADGIMGMENEKTAFWKQMHTKSAIPRPEFSLCFSRSDQADRDGTGAGAMTLGGVDPRLHASPMVFAKNVKGSGFYAVHLKAVYMRKSGGVSAQTRDMSDMKKLPLSEDQLNRGNVIVDSGTTDTYFNSQLAGPFKKMWKEMTGKDYNHSPREMTKEQIDKLPTIILIISGYADQTVGDEPSDDPNDVANYVGDVTDLSSSPRDIVLAIPGAHYMEYDPDNGKYVPRFYTEESSGSVLGANAMMGHDVYFDIARGRIGFAESECDYVSLVLSEGGSISVAPDRVSESEKIEVPGEEEEETLEEIEEAVEALVEKVEEEEEEEEAAKAESPPEPPAPVIPEPAEPAPESPEVEPVPPPGPDQPNDETPYEIFDKPPQGGRPFPHGKGGISGKAEEILEDMKHECASAGCRGIAALLVLGAAVVVTVAIRRAMARRRVVRQYQEAELEISDLALDSDSDGEDEVGGYEDEPSVPQIT